MTLNHFTVLTDNNPLTYVLTSAKLDATGHRWASALGEYSFDIFYRPGLKNTDADSMSRYPFEKEGTGMEQIPGDTIKAVCNCIIQVPYVETLPACDINIVEATEIPGQTLSLKELREVRRLQREDPMIEKWRKAVIDKRLPKNIWSNDDLTMRKQFKNFKMKRGLLFRVVREQEEEIEQLVIPLNSREEILKGLHNNVGHPGKERTMRLMRERYYWPGMSSSVEKWVTACERCIRRKSPTNERAPLVNIRTTYPLELVCFDYLTLEPSKGGVANILVITDHFTKYAMAIPTRNQTAKTTAEAFYNNFILNFGIPTRLHSDQGANFESDIIQELCILTNMKKTHTTPYHPQGNAGPERFNRTLLDMLGTLNCDQKQDWKKYVSSLVYFYNCTPHESTKFTPYELMFGRKPKLPIDLEYENVREENQSKSTKEYINNLKDRLEQTRKILESHTEKAKNKQKKYYDKKARSVELFVGDRVLVKKVAFEGKHKIADKFEEEPYTITEQPRPEIPVFKVKSESSGIEKTLHRNLLLKIEGKDRENEIEEGESHEELDKEIPQEKEQEKKETDHDVMRNEDLSDDEDGIVFRTFHGGDAHNHITGTESEKKDRGVENQNIFLTEAAEEMTADEESRNEEREDVPEVSGKVDEGTRIETERGQENVVENDTDTQQDKDKEDSNESEYIGQKVDSTETFIQTEERNLPVPAPRRSSRLRKPPDRFGEYVSNVMSPRPIDTKIHAVNELMKSGILNSVDTDTALKILSAILN